MLQAMKRLAFAHREKVWITAVWGWIFLLVAGAGALVLASRHAYFFLAPSEPSGARLLIVEGWMTHRELDQAVDEFRIRGYGYVLTTGGPVQARAGRTDPISYAESARDYLVRRGLPADSVIAVPAPDASHNRTFLSAVKVREWLQHSGLAVDAIDVISSGAHSRRSWALYQMAFGSRVRVGILSTRPTAYDGEAWWRTSIGAKTVIYEALALMWTELFFRYSSASNQTDPDATSTATISALPVVRG